MLRKKVPVPFQPIFCKMRNLQLTLDTPAENLALDLGLLEAAEAHQLTGDVLRLWEPKQYFVVLGRSSDPAVEVDLAACRLDGVEVLRRVSGGATVVTGPGCLMYAVVLGYESKPWLRDISAAHRFVLETTATALAELVPDIVEIGTSDLAIPCPANPEIPLPRREGLGEGRNRPSSLPSPNLSPKGRGASEPSLLLRKFSGNSLRCRRNHLLYHGTLLYDFDLPRIARWLKTPPRQPDYRQARPHQDFLTNLPATRAAITTALLDAWEATEPLAETEVPLAKGQRHGS